jgi:predicted DNA-binding protein YlxM (UPF0122 family)
MIEMEYPSNIKPNKWYKEYVLLNKLTYPLDDIALESITIEKEIDRYLHDFVKIYNHRQDFSEEIGPPEIISFVFSKYKDFFVTDSKCCYDPEDKFWFIAQNDTIERNRTLVSMLRKYTQSKIPPRDQKLIDFINLKLDFLEKTLPNNLITFQLNEIRDLMTDGYPQGSIYCSYDVYFTPLISELYFEEFETTEVQIFDLIRKNEKWHDINRDLTIYQERQKGKYLQELADNVGIKFNSISMIVKKVQSAINYYKGKLFEDFVEKKLIQSGLFEKVLKEAGKGECDVLAYTKDGKGLYIYSLKNIKIDRKPYWLITKEELLPELKDSKLSSLDYDTHLILLVYDNHHKRVFQTEIDYNHVENIDISNS